VVGFSSLAPCKYTWHSLYLTNPFPSVGLPASVVILIALIENTGTTELLVIHQFFTMSHSFFLLGVNMIMNNRTEMRM
jgi:hypothetical protein